MARKLYFACNFDASGLPGFPPTSCMFAAVLEYSSMANLVDMFDHYREKGLKTANLMPSKKAAKELCDAWNETYKANGTYAF